MQRVKSEYQDIFLQLFDFSLGVVQRAEIQADNFRLASLWGVRQARIPQDGRAAPDGWTAESVLHARDYPFCKSLRHN